MNKLQNPMIHPTADAQSSHIGEGTNIWQYVVVLPKARIGRDCNICAQVFIENNVVVGDRVTIKNGVQLWDGLRIEDDVFIGPNVTFTNDKLPRSKVYPETFPITIVCRGASIGGGAVVLPGLVIGEQAMVGAGAVVTRDVPSRAIVVGNPAHIIGYVDVGK
jgi:acetyltransferase-like isoleucine patch superfamily enzyme